MRNPSTTGLVGAGSSRIRCVSGSNPELPTPDHPRHMRSARARAQRVASAWWRSCREGVRRRTDNQGTEICAVGVIVKPHVPACCRMFPHVPARCG